MNNLKKQMTLLAVLYFFVSNVYAQQKSESFLDTRDGKSYKTIKIGQQIWLAENLSYKCENGCWAYEDCEDSARIYGYLYDYETAKKLCPSGWRLPNKVDFETLLDNYGGSGETSYKALIPNAISGMSMLFSGWRNSGGRCYFIGESTSFWVQTKNDGKYVWYIHMHKETENVFFDKINIKSWGLSVRCIKDK